MLGKLNIEHHKQQQHTKIPNSIFIKYVIKAMIAHKY